MKWLTCLLTTLLILSACGPGRPKRSRRTSRSRTPTYDQPVYTPIPASNHKSSVTPVQAKIDSIRAKYDEVVSLVRKEEFARAEQIALQARKTLQDDPDLDRYHEAANLMSDLNKMIVLCRKSVSGAAGGGSYYQPNPQPYHSEPWGVWNRPKVRGPSSRGAPPPPGVERSAAVESEEEPEPEPPPRTVNWKSFGETLQSFPAAVGGNTAKSKEVSAKVWEMLPLAPDEMEPLATGVWGLLRMLQRKTWTVSAQESAALKAYSDRFFKEPKSLDDVKAIEFLLGKLEGMGADEKSGNAIRWMVQTHVDRLVATDQEQKVRLSYDQKRLLGLSSKDGEWSTRDRRLLTKLKEGRLAYIEEGIDSGRPEVQVVALLSLLRSLSDKDVEDQLDGKKMFVKGVGQLNEAPVEIAGSVRTAKGRLNRIKPCPRCKGTNRVPLHNGSGDSSCSRCSGPFRVPPIDEILKAEECATCDKDGFLSDRIGMVCPDCLGLGVRYK